jgi:hypothetical protein
MSTAEMALLFQGIGKASPACRCLRIVLLPGEILKLPHWRSRVRVLSGTAWVTQSGRDIILSEGERMDRLPGRDRPLISGVRDQALLFEVL